MFFDVVDFRKANSPILGAHLGSVCQGASAGRTRAALVCWSVFGWEKNCRGTALGLGDDPKLLAFRRAISAQQTKASESSFSLASSSESSPQSFDM